VLLFAVGVDAKVCRPSSYNVLQFGKSEFAMQLLAAVGNDFAELQSIVGCCGLVIEQLYQYVCYLIVCWGHHRASNLQL